MVARIPDICCAAFIKGKAASNQLLKLAINKQAFGITKI
jgi:hypothetical protein